MHALAPYEGPHTSAPGLDLTARARRALLFSVVPFGVIAGGIVAAITGIPGAIGALVFVSAAFIGLAGVAAGMITAIKLLKIAPELRPPGIAFAITAIPVGIVSAGIGALTAMASVFQVTRGRQLRRRGRVILAPLSDRSSWLPKREVIERLEAPDGVADAWRTNGLTEHASVAAFARLSMELVSLGAPSSLVEAAHKDALDEMRHTALCFDLARSIDGRSVGPAELPVAAAPGATGPRRLRLARLAVESLIDGALNEGLSARVIAELASRASTPEIYGVLAVIARDEARHAAHAFDVVRWCVSEGGLPVSVALRSAIAVLPEGLSDGLCPDAADGRWEPWGIPGRDREERGYASVRSKLVSRTERLLDAELDRLVQAAP
jgi:hypothetical protein